MAEIIYKNIQKLASEQKLSIRQIESACELGNGTIAKIETGNPTVATLEKISNVLGCTVIDLLKEG